MKLGSWGGYNEWKSENMRGNNTYIVHKNKLNQTTIITPLESKSKKHPLLRPKSFNFPLFTDIMLVFFNKINNSIAHNSSIISIFSSYTISMQHHINIVANIISIRTTVLHAPMLTLFFWKQNIIFTVIPIIHIQYSSFAIK